MKRTASARDLMIEGRHNQKGDAKTEETKRCDLNRATDRVDFAEELLKCGLECKAEQDLCTQNEEPGFVERRLQLRVEFL